MAVAQTEVALVWKQSWLVHWQHFVVQKDAVHALVGGEEEADLVRVKGDGGVLPRDVDVANDYLSFG